MALLSTIKPHTFRILRGVLMLALLAGCSVPASPSPATLPANPAAAIATQPLPTLAVPSPATEAGPLPAATATLPPVPTATATLTPTATQPPATRFAVIGDFGDGGQSEMAIAEMINTWKVDFVITVGDDNYPSGAASTIDNNVGKAYHSYIFPYKGQFGQGADKLRFFPTLGNHDWLTKGAQAYFDYFELPGNERYYDFTWGPAHFFALDSDSHEPDGVSSNSVQANWLKEKMTASTSPWNIVYFHHPPYSSGLHGPTDWMLWPFKDWGASVVLSGHDHTYERLVEDGLTYFVNGVGGASRYDFTQVEAGSQVRYNDAYGAMLVTATDASLLFQFYNINGELIDETTIKK